MITTVIFDMDGVISDTQKIHSAVESRLLEGFGIRLSPDEITTRYSGVKTSEFFQDLLQAKKIKVDIGRLMAEKMKIMLEEVKKSISPIKGSRQLISELYKNNFKLGVASASSHEFIDETLNRLDVKKYFTVLTGGDEVKNGKPDPEIFLNTAKKLESQPNECLVIEDGFSGMQAAKRANMKCIGLIREGDTRMFPADITVYDLTKITLDMISGV